MKFYRKMRVRRFMSIKVYAVTPDELDHGAAALAEASLIPFRIMYNEETGINYAILRHERQHTLDRTNPFLWFHHRHSFKRRELWLEARATVAQSQQNHLDNPQWFLREYTHVIARATGNSPTLAAEFIQRAQTKVKDRGPVQWV